MESGPIIVSILFSFVAMIISAVVVARNEDHTSDLKRQIMLMKSEFEKINRESRDAIRKAADVRRDVERIEAINKASLEAIKTEMTELTVSIDARFADIGKKVPDKRSA